MPLKEESAVPHHHVKGYKPINGVFITEIDMPKHSTDAEWSDKAKNLLRSELKRKGVTYAQLSDLLYKIDVNENEKNIANKISRGVFTMAFFLQCMSAIDVTELRL